MVCVLLVEDNPGDARLITEHLREAEADPFELKHAESLADALNLLSEEPIDALLLDLSLPDVTGIETVIRTRQAHPEIPIVVLTGNDDDELALHALREGAQDYLIKDRIEPDLLVRSLRYAMERHRLERERDRQNKEIQRLAAFVRFNPNPVVELGPRGELLYWNDSAESMARRLRTDAVEDLLPERIPERVHNCLTEGRCQVDISSTVAERTISWAFFPIPSNHVVHAYGVDITDERNLEMQLRHSQKMEAVGELAAGIAHDFNNILTIVRGQLELISHGGLPDRLSKTVSRTLAATDRAANLTRQLLAFSRRQTLEPRPIDLNTVTQDIAKMLKRVVGEGITLKVEPAPNTAPTLADTGMMEQALMNLVVNARDAMPRGGEIRIGVDCRHLGEGDPQLPPDVRPGPYVCLTVRDSGHGMDVETQQRIFEPFFSTKPTGQGTGLGLAVVYGIVQQHQGWIHVSSEADRGTCFAIYLPRTDRPVEISSPSQEIMAGYAQGEVVLLVEDEADLLHLVQSALEEHRFDVIPATSAAEARHIFHNLPRKIDLAIIDMVLPGGTSGLELTTTLMEHAPDLKVILTSGYSMENALQHPRLSQHIICVPKPYRPKKLVEVALQQLQ